MSHTYLAGAKRFIRRYSAANASATYASLAAASEALRLLQSTPWTLVDADTATSFPPHVEIEASHEAMDAYDAYLTCGDHADGQHRAYAGMAAYRIELPAAAVGLTLESVTLQANCDPYNPFGARVAVATTASTEANPSQSWITAREGAAHADGVAPRTTSADGARWYPAVASATLVPDGGLVLGKYVWIYISLENHERARNGWLEGAARLVPTFQLTTSTAITGYADGDDLDGGYPAPSEIVSIGSRSNEPKARTVSAPTGTGRNRYREVLAVASTLSYANSSSDPTATNAVPAVYALLAKALGRPFTMPSPGSSLPDSSTFYDYFSPVDFATGGWSVWQWGLAATIQRYWNASTSTQQLWLLVSMYLAQISIDPSFTPRRLTLRHPAGASTLTLGSVRVRVSAWWVPQAMTTLFGALALRSNPTFWTGRGATTVTGTIADNTASPAYEETVNATYIGSVALTDSITAGQEFWITVGAPLSRYGTLILVPWIDGIDTPLALGDTRGLGTMNTHTAYELGQGWVPDIILS